MQYTEINDMMNIEVLLCWVNGGRCSKFAADNHPRVTLNSSLQPGAKM